MPSKHRPQRPHCSSGTEGGSALQQRGSALQQPASAMRAAGTQKLRVVGYDRGVHVPLAPLLRRRRSAQSSGHVVAKEVRTPKYKSQVVKSKKIYDRKKKEIL